MTVKEEIKIEWAGNIQEQLFIPCFFKESPYQGLSYTSA